MGQTKDGARVLLDPQLQNAYSYARNNPVLYTDPQGRIIPLLAAAYIAAEAALSAYDAYNTYQTVTSQSTSRWEKAATAGGFVLGTVAPGAGYGTAGRGVVKAVPITTASHTANNYRRNLVNLTGVNPVGYDAHHVFPQAFNKDFSRVGINIHDPKYLAWWQNSASGGTHQVLSSQYNKNWQAFFAQNSNPSKQQIEQFGQTLSNKYNIKTNY